jgi:hypothetical protein
LNQTALGDDFAAFEDWALKTVLPWARRHRRLDKALNGLTGGNELYGAGFTSYFAMLVEQSSRDTLTPTPVHSLPNNEATTEGTQEKKS